MKLNKFFTENWVGIYLYINICVIGRQPPSQSTPKLFCYSVMFIL